MKGTLMRGASTDLGTPGQLTLEDGWGCVTLELPWRGNAKGVSCVKAGAYIGRRYFSPHLGRDVILFEDKNGRGDVECHNGNFAGDAAQGHFTQVHGCMLPGSSYGEVLLPDKSGNSQWGIKNSKVTLDGLLEALGEEVLELEIEWEAAVWPDDDV